MVGIFSDSHGDLNAFNAAYELLRKKGARRYFFAGGRYTDLDEWILSRKKTSRGGRGYSDLDFLADISAFLGEGAQVDRPPAFSEQEREKAAAAAAAPVEEDLNKVKERFLRTPEKDSLQYRDPNIGKKSVDMLGDILCCIVYDKNDLDRDDLTNAVVFVHGRESEPKVVQIGPRYFVTAGKLTGASEQTCGMLEVVEKNLVFSAFTLDGRTVIDKQVLQVDRRKKLSVK